MIAVYLPLSIGCTVSTFAQRTAFYIKDASLLGIVRGYYDPGSGTVCDGVIGCCGKNVLLWTLMVMYTSSL
ncbi:hypothetical protein CCP3SC15_930024 [Gammaproteobacteria bacterium]